MVYAVIYCIVVCLWLRDAIVVNILIGACVCGVLRCEAVGQVYHVAHLSFLEQGGVALARYLLHLPAHWWQHQHILSCCWVGRYLHALALCLHLGQVLHALCCLVVQVCGVALSAVRVGVLIYQP